MTREQDAASRSFSAFLVPRRLEVTPLEIDRVLFVGQCLLYPWIAPIQASYSPGTQIDFVLFNNFAELADEPEHPASDYAFQVVSLPLRSMLPETFYLNIAYSDAAAVEALFQGTCDRLDVVLEAAMKWNLRHGLLSFVANFLVPQQNPDGRLMPRYDLRNMVFFIEKLNEYLATRVAAYRNAHVIDVDAIAASFGRRYVQDDALWINSHGSLLYDHDTHYDVHRLEPPPHPPSVEFELRTETFVGEVWHGLLAMLRTLRQMDPVKMVIVDLDDTLWRGVLAEQEVLEKADTEGWPLGMVEALMRLKRRGVILAIASRNEEAAVARIFDELYAFRIHLSDFALKRINWKPKVETIAELLEDANLLPSNVVFIDDNPVERAAVSEAFPTMRILGASLYAIRRDLLWSAETQVATITADSERRSATIEAKVNRDGARKTMSRRDFLASLDVRLALFEIVDRDANFPRAFELLNKTNQFNTTGRRWRDDELAERLQAGLRMIGVEVKDSFTDYGFVGIVLVEGATIVQFAMSCRVFGLGIEDAVVRLVADEMVADGTARIEAAFVETSSNAPCRELFPRCGFERREGGWAAEAAKVGACPEHVTTEVRFRREREMQGAA